MHGPFVVNTADEIRQAMIDFQTGRFGEIAS
jgi:quercetin 2,3-dioxygenase